MTWMIAVLIGLALFVQGSIVWAEEKKGQACPEQLTQISFQANNLATDRAQKEEALAKEQVLVYMLRQQIAQLQKQLAEMKKTAEPTIEGKKAE